MSRELKQHEKAAVLEGAVYDEIEHRVVGDLESGIVRYVNGEKLELKWSDEMSTDGGPGDDLLVVDQDGTEYVLDIEVFLRARTKKPVVNADTQDPLPLEYDPATEGE